MDEHAVGERDVVVGSQRQARHRSCTAHSSAPAPGARVQPSSLHTVSENLLAMVDVAIIAIVGPRS
jgi:hypothetical protein